jgi:hypothetical protein
VDGTADIAITTGKLVFEKRVDDTDQAFAARARKPDASDDAMGIMKMWDSSGGIAIKIYHFPILVKKYSLLPLLSSG